MEPQTDDIRPIRRKDDVPDRRTGGVLILPTAFVFALSTSLKHVSASARPDTQTRQRRARQIRTGDDVAVNRPGREPHMACDLRVCSCDRTRTYNLPVNSRLLCQLSYAGMLAGEPAFGASVGYRTSQRHLRPSRRYSTATERGDNVECRGYVQLQIRTDSSAT